MPIVSPAPVEPVPQQASSSSLKNTKPKSKSKLNKRLSSENKENQNVQLQYCSRISIDEYEGQKLLGGTSQSLRSLLEFYINDPKIDDEFRRKKLVEVCLYF